MSFAEKMEVRGQNKFNIETMNSINALENDLYGLTISQEGHLVWGKNTIHKDLCSLKYIILEEMNDRARCCNDIWPTCCTDTPQ